MLRWLIKLILLAVLAALLYGLWLLYQEKSPEEKSEIKGRAAQTLKGVSRTLAEAGKKVFHKGKEQLRTEEAGRER